MILVAICQNKVTLTFNKPAYVGICVSNLSKVLVYEFHQDYIKNSYGKYNYNKKYEAKLLFTNIDSLMYETKTEDIYEDFSKNEEIFDFSNYSTQSKFMTIQIDYQLVK